MMKNNKSAPVIALVALVCVAVAVGAYYLLYSPMLTERSADIDAAVAVEAQNDKAREELSALKAEQAKIEERKAQLEEALAKFPSSQELTQFTRYLADVAENTGAHVASISAADPVEITVAQQFPAGPDGSAAPVVPPAPQGLYRFGFTITLEGTWQQTRDYLEALQREGSRMFLVYGVAMSMLGPEPVASLDGLAQYTVRGYTYALLDPDKISTTSNGE
jgi:hypothetical protein